MKASAVRQAIRRGGRDVTFDAHPRLEPGQLVVLRWSKSKGPTDWVRIEWVRQSKPGTWTVRVRRYRLGAPRTLRSGPLPFTDPERLREDRIHPPTRDEIAAAREESAYRHGGDPLDAGECVGDEWLSRFSRDSACRRGEQIREAIEGA